MATPNIVVDGIPYAPATGQQPARIGVGITSRNRNKILAQALDHHRAHLPRGAALVLIDDASDKPVDGADHRFDTQAGIATAKNKAIELLIDAGCEHLFLFDDDIWPTIDGWWEPYVTSPEPHLMYIFGDLKKGAKLNDIHQLHADDQHVAWSGPRGCMLYAHRTVIDTVGGMDPIYNPWGYEHGDWSNRIHHAGLTTWRYADVRGSEHLFHSLDEWGEANRTITTPERERLARDHVRIHHQRRDTWYRAYVDYRQPDDDVIATTLFTGGTTTRPARDRTSYKPDVKLLKPLADSIRHGRLIVFHDQLVDPKLATGNGRPVEFIEQPSPKINFFLYRHQVIWQWLHQHAEVRRIWAVDGTDVTQLRDPFTGMQPGKIHLGWEPKTLADPWMLDRHKEHHVHQFLTDHPALQLLNAGLIGGDRATMLEFLHQLYAYWYDVEMVSGPHDQGDMGQLQRLAYEHFADRLVTGTQVATVFKAFQGDNGLSWWAHK